MIGIYLVHGWMHLFMVQVDYRLFDYVDSIKHYTLVHFT
jgi:hypothetical protein